MQKDIQKSKGETSQQKFENKPFTDKPTVGETTGHKLKEVGHDINAGLKENIGVGVGNYSSFEDRKESKKEGKKYEQKKEGLKERAFETKEEVKGTTETLGHKVQEIAHDVNATLKQNVGIGVGNYSSEQDKKMSKEHRKKYEEQIQPVKQNIETKKEEIKSNLNEKTEQLKDKAYEGQTGVYTHRIQEVGHTLNANLKETVGVGIGDYSSEVDRQKAEEHWKGYQEKVKETSKVEVSDSNPIVHKIKEVAHNVNANLKEMIGVGVGNYSSEVDRELSEIHHQKYEEKVHNNTNLEQGQSSTPTSSENLTTGIDFEKKKEKLEGKLFGGPKDNEPKKETETKKFDEPNKKFDESDFPKL